MSRATLPPLEDDFSRALLGSADADGPSNAAYAKAAAALGLGVGLGVGASLPVPAAAAGVAGIARWSSSLGAKLVALGVSGGLLVGSGALLRGGSPPSQVGVQTGSAPALSRAQRAIEPAQPAANSPATDRDLTALPLVPPSVPASSAGQTSPPVAKRPFVAAQPARRVPHASPAHVSAARVSSASSLAEQVQSLDRARVALRAGDSSSALREIADYRAAWPNGVFLTEASVLEVEALAARGERSLAATRAADFVAAHPDSPQAGRLRALIPAKKR
ncbi:MAG TPA: hypothetical protein VJV79_25240 [Polyangiaceae bacterium]|nr:hypothetical protein [Polyangiaceae bacterium]